MKTADCIRKQTGVAGVQVDIEQRKMVLGRSCNAKDR